MSKMNINIVEAGKVGDLKSGEMKMVIIKGREILLARAGDEYYAANNRCPHMGAELSRGKLEGTIVTCPRHQSKFDLKDGHVVRWTNWPSALVTIDKVRSSPRSIRVYPVVLEGDKIMIKMQESK